MLTTQYQQLQVTVSNFRGERIVVLKLKKKNSSLYNTNYKLVKQRCPVDDPEYTTVNSKLKLQRMHLSNDITLTYTFFFFFTYNMLRYLFCKQSFPIKLLETVLFIRFVVHLEM